MMREKVGWSSKVERNFTGSRQFSPHQAQTSQSLRETVTTASKNAESNVDRDSLLSTPQWLGTHWHCAEQPVGVEQRQRCTVNSYRHYRRGKKAITAMITMITVFFVI